MACGKPIYDIQHLYYLSNERKSVTCPKRPAWRGPIPAAFIMRLQGIVIYRIIQDGLYEYKAKSQTKKGDSNNETMATKSKE